MKGENRTPLAILLIWYLFLSLNSTSFCSTSSYGSVHKAIHARTSTTVAIKMIPIENDLDDSIKEINIMTGCDSDYVVRFYGHYLKDGYLWVSFLLSFVECTREVQHLGRSFMTVFFLSRSTATQNAHYMKTFPHR